MKMDESLEKSIINSELKPHYGSKIENATQDLREFDILEETIGSFGRWQCKMLVLLSLLKIPIAWIQLSIVFIAPMTEFWCKPPPEFENVSTSEWKSMISLESNNFTNMLPQRVSCYMVNVLNSNSSNSIIPCEWGYEYNHSEIYSSIISDWDLVCDNSILVNITQMVTMFGILLGMTIFSPAADKFGRKPILIISICLQTLCGILTALSPWYNLFLILKFFVALTSSGAMTLCFVMVIEFTAGYWRTVVTFIEGMYFGIGYTLMALMAYYVRNWRYLQLIQFALCLLFFSYYWCVPESPRWLLAVNRKEEALVILEHAAKLNGVEVSHVRRTFKKYQHIRTDNISVETESFIKTIITNRTIRARTFFLCCNWLVIGFLYYGMYQLSGTVTENSYVSVAIVGLTAIPSHICGLFAVKKYGRKINITVANLFTALPLLIYMLVPRTLSYHFWIEVLLIGIAVFANPISFGALHLFTGELYPTVLRNSAMGLNMMFAKLGAMGSPFIVGAAIDYWYVPFLVFGIVSALESLLLLPLPETLHMKLPELVEDLKHS